MADQIVTQTPPVQAVLACRLRHARLGRSLSPTAGEVELENTSASAIEIEADMHPLQYLELVVTDSAGTVISEEPYAHMEPHRRLSLKYTQLFGTVL